MEFCNTIIHGELGDEGPVKLHETCANATHPAIITCWARYLEFDSSAGYNEVLRLLMPKRTDTKYKTFTSMPARLEGFYDISFQDVVLENSNTNYNHSFEYTVYIFNEIMDYTVATCGIRYHSSTTSLTECWSPTFTLIRYDTSGYEVESSTSSENEDTTTTSIPQTTSEASTVTTEGTTTDEVATTSTGAKIPPTTVEPPSPTALGQLAELITGFGTGAFILTLVVLVTMVVVLGGIIWVKRCAVSADMRDLRANQSEMSTRENRAAVSDSEGEEKNPN